MNLCIIGGSGYVGFITGLGFAELGNRVINVDIDDEKVQVMNNGKSPIYEEDIDLSTVLKRNLDDGHIAFTTDLEKGVKHAEVIFIAVGTPEKEDGEADLSQVIGVAEDLLKYIDRYKVIVMKSTVPVGTVELICSILKREKEEGKDFDVVANPEFLREGKGLYDFFHPTRIVIGTNSDRAKQIMHNLYAPFLSSESLDLQRNERVNASRNKRSNTNSQQQITNSKEANSKLLTANGSFKGNTPIVETDVKSAQMIKYASNSFLASRISFINEIAGLCEKVGGDVTEVAKGMGYDDRIGHEYLQAGIGFGGPCLEKDLKALIRIAENNNYEPNFLHAIMEKNEHQVKQVVAKVKELAGYPLYKKIITVFGLAFKAGTNDVRTSLALRIIDLLEKEGAHIKAYDPEAIPEARKVKPEIEYFNNPYKAVRHAEVLLVLTDWPEFKEFDFSQIKNQMSSANLVDGRNVLEPELLKDLGFKYRGIGRD